MKKFFKRSIFMFLLLCISLVAMPSALGQATSWTGEWDSDFGVLTMTQTGDVVVGTYPHDKGKIEGTVNGNKLIGTWSEAPTYKPLNDAGNLEFTMSDDGKLFTGQWRYGATGSFSKWNGTRKTPLPTSVATDASNLAIPETVIKTGTSAVLGKGSSIGWSLSIPKGSFAKDESVSLTKHTTNVIAPAEFIPFGTPVAVQVKGLEFVRLGAPVAITVQIPKDDLKNIKNIEDVYAAYHYQGKWEYFMPDSVDLAKGIAVFSTYHFSDLSLGTLSEDGQITNFAKKTAIQRWSNELGKKEFTLATKDYFHAALKKMGFQDTAARDKMIKDIITTNNVADIVDTMCGSDLIAKNNKLYEIVGSTLLRVVKLDSGTFGKSTLITGAAASAIGSFSEGDYKGGMQAIADGLKNAVPTAKIVTAISEYGVKKGNEYIDSWKDNELENAYQAYKNGSDGKCGYEVNAKDFGNVILQMKGAYQRFSTGAVDDYCAKFGIARSTLTQKRYAQILKDAEAALKASFDRRIKADTEIEKRIDNEKKIITAMKASGFLKADFNKAFSVKESIEERLLRLYQIRANVISAIGEVKAKEIGEERICGLMKVWMATTNLKDQAGFYAHLKKLGYLKAAVAGNKEYKWVLVNTIDYEDQAGFLHANTSPVYENVMTYSRGSYSMKTTYKGKSDDYYNPPVVNGEALAVQAKWSTPPQTIKNGETVSLKVSIGILSNTQSYFKFSGTTKAYFDEPQITPGFGTRQAVSFATAKGVSSFQTDFNNGYASVSETVSAIPPTGRNVGDKIALLTTFYMGTKMGTAYIYEWKAQ